MNVLSVVKNSISGENALSFSMFNRTVNKPHMLRSVWASIGSLTMLAKPVPTSEATVVLSIVNVSVGKIDNRTRSVSGTGLNRGRCATDHSAYDVALGSLAFFKA